jgi:hypothetical protein
MAHLVLLAMWGGVVATEAVLEVASYRRSELAEATSRFHYWIDLLVELPVVLGVLATGITAAILSDRLTWTHAVKFTFAGLAVAVNLFCIAVVLRRDRRRLAGVPADRLRTASRVVLACFALGLLFAAVAAALGFSLALSRVR